MAEPLEEEAVEDALAPGTSLLRGQYEIIRFLNSGGFGITYLARDSLERDVVVKECFPSALCVREGDRVVAQSENARDDLSSIIKLFIQEARNHAKLIHPNIVPVHQVFEDNDTAYIAMDYVRGCDLLDYMDQPDTSFTVDEFVALT
ncbi:MAG: protein kinase, partial [Halocynthiibacter sp.]